MLENAIEVDINFYEAYRSLANAYYQAHSWGILSLKEARPAAHAAITSAMALFPDEVSYQFQLAQIHLRIDLDYARSEAVFRQLLKHAPKQAWLHHNLASIALREGRTSEALRQMANASDFVIAEEAIFFGLTAWVRNIGGDYEGALKASAQGLKLALGGQDRTFILQIHAQSLIMLGRVGEAKPFVEEGWHLDGSTSPEVYVSSFVYIGETEKAKKILTDSRFNLLNHYYLAMGHLALGDIDNTFKSIQAGIEDHNMLLIDSLIVAEWWNPIRDDPRFAEMLQLLDSKVTHTEKYLRDHKNSQIDR